MSERPFSRRIGYNALHVFSRLFGVLLYGIRVGGREHVPREGGVLVCANHQSFFDPVLVGLACDRRLNYLARKSLFRKPGFRQLIEYFDSIPIDREGFGLEGLKETLRRLRRGEMVLIFPEGTRTHTGRVQTLKPGFCALARRGKSPLLPVGIDGAFTAWPRGHKLPGVARIHIEIGEPLWPESFVEYNDAALIAELENRIAACWEKARGKRGD